MYATFYNAKAIYEASEQKGERRARKSELVCEGAACACACVCEAVNI